MRYTTFAETQSLLRAALGLQGYSIKAIAEAIGVMPNTLYKFTCGYNQLSPKTSDRLLNFLVTYEPQRLEKANNINNE